MKNKKNLGMLVLLLTFGILLAGCELDVEPQYEGKFFVSVTTALSAAIYYEDGTTTLTGLYNSTYGQTIRGNKSEVTNFLVNQFADKASGASIVSDVIRLADQYGLSVALLGSGNNKWAVGIKKL